MPTVRPERDTGRRAYCYGAGRDLGRLVKTHLFGITVNHSGSTFLRGALATCHATWNLPSEGQFAGGYSGPHLEWGALTGALKIWGSRPRWRDALKDESAYNWARTREAWYFQAYALDPHASVFFTNSPPHLLLVDALARPFRQPEVPVHGAQPLRHLRRNLQRPGAARRSAAAWGRGRKRRRGMSSPASSISAATSRPTARRGVFFTYEAMCAEPERVASEIRALVPELDDLTCDSAYASGRYEKC